MGRIFHYADDAGEPFDEGKPSFIFGNPPTLTALPEGIIPGSLAASNEL